MDATSTEELDGARAVFEATRWSGAPDAARAKVATDVEELQQLARCK